MGESVQKTLLWNTDYDRENKDYTDAIIYVCVVSNGVIFPQISYDIVPYARHLLPVRFFPSISNINYASTYLKI